MSLVLPVEFTDVFESLTTDTLWLLFWCLCNISPSFLSLQTMKSCSASVLIYLQLLLILNLQSFLCIFDWGSRGNCGRELCDKAQVFSVWCHYELWDSRLSNVCPRWSSADCSAVIINIYTYLHINVNMNSNIKRQHFVDSPCTRQWDVKK